MTDHRSITGLRNLPLHSFAQNRTWCAIVTLAANLTRHSRQAVLTLNQKQPWATLALQAVTAVRALPAPG